MTTTEDMAGMILEHIPYYQNWDRDIFLGWLDWYDKQGLIQRVFDYDNSLVGLVLIRTIMRPQDAVELYVFDPEGSVAFIEAVVATKPGVIQKLVEAGLKRFGHRDWMAWRRSPYYVTVFHETKRVLKLLSRGGLHHGRR